MLFVAEPQNYYYHSMPSVQIPIAYNEYLAHLQRERRREQERAYIQQQYERKLLLKLNQPRINKFQDGRNYYIVMSKNVNPQTYSYINKFTDQYELRQMGEELVVRSKIDNFYQSFSLPSDVDLEKDITFQVLKNGYQLKITIPKKQRSDIVVLKYITDASFAVPSTTLSNITVANSKSLCPSSAQSFDISTDKNIKGANEKDNVMSPPNSSSSTSESPIESNVEQNLQVREQEQEEGTKDTSGSSQNISIGREGSKSKFYYTSSDSDSTRFRKGGASTPSEGSLQTNQHQELSFPKGRHGLRNYETTRRRTIFAPNEVDFKNDDDDDNNNSSSETDSDVEAATSIPVKKVRSPTVEDLVDEEFA